MSQYDKNGRLTRTAAEQIIRRGGSVSVGNRIYADVAKLPNEAEFAKGNKEAEDAARQRLLDQRRALDEQLKSLEAPAAPTTAPDAQHDTQHDKAKVRTTAAKPA